MEQQIIIVVEVLQTYRQIASYLRQGGYDFIAICLFVCLFVC